MKRYPSQFGTVTLTNERWRHIVEYHPEVVKYSKHILVTLVESELVVMSKHDSLVFVFYKPVGRNLKLAVVVGTRKPNIILTAYLTTKTNKL